MKCTICNSNHTKILDKKHPGYIEDTFFKVYGCSDCNTTFINPKGIDTKIYDIIYKKGELTPGYSRYFKYAKKVKEQKEPLKFLANQETSYYPIYKFLKGINKKLDILEVGCSYGYTSYSMANLNHNVTGIDISKDAISSAKENFKNINFICGDILETNDVKKYDLIVATELIEHLEDIPKFIKKCSSLLNEHGHLVFSTPNKESWEEEIWHTDLPPIHTVCLSRESFKALANDNNFNVRFIDFNKYYGREISKFVLLFKKQENVIPLIKSNGEFIQGKWRKNRVQQTIKDILLFLPIRILLKEISNLFKKENSSLGVIMEK